MKKAKELIASLARLAGSLDDRIFFAVVAIGIISVSAAFILGLFQGLSFFSELTTGVCGLWLLALGIVSIRCPSARRVCRVILVCGLNFALLPLAYFASGAMTSGVILFYLVGLFLVTALLRGRARKIVFVASVCVMLLSFYLGRVHPELVTPMPPEQQYQDVKITFFITSLTLGAMTAGILNAYDAEQARNRELMERLTSLSVRDPLSGLYNRRELFRRLEQLYAAPGEGGKKPETGQCYIAMFDVDNFKRLNDTYGHQFGDTVLSAVSRRLSAAAREEGEIAARYGGEEFVCVIHAAGPEEAFARVDAVRAEIGALAWEDVPDLRVTVSGGLVSCAQYPDLKTAMRDVDQLLYQAKAAGKNRIADHLAERSAEG